MSGIPDSGQLDLAEVFRRVQAEMLSQLALGRLFEHATTLGSATEHHWLDLFQHYLPQRFRASPAFIINARGRRSRQIDLAIYDNFASPLLFPHAAGVHVPIEAVYAVFEVKPAISRHLLRYAGEKAASVRALAAPSRRKILAGLLATRSIWNPATFATNLDPALAALPRAQQIDFGCALEHGSFERTPRRHLALSDPTQSLAFFVLRFLTRLQRLGPAPQIDLLKYLRELRSSPPAA